MKAKNTTQDQEKKLVLIGLGTLQRPQMLSECLKSISMLSIPENYSLELQIIDNDVEGSSESIVQRRRTAIPFPVNYKIESKRGIVHMRNAVLLAAKTKRASLIAFIDDDEIVEPTWISTMIDTMNEYDADVVHGRVQRQLPDSTPFWLIKGKFFESAHRPTGLIRNSASTSNVLINNRIFNEFGLEFHQALNLTGSSDTYLFAQATKLGAKIVWCDATLVTEFFPESRANPNWIKQRAFRRTNSKYIRNVLDRGVIFSKLAFSFLGIIQMTTGALLFVSMGITGPIWRLKAQQLIWKGLGCWNGVLGKDYKEYETIHGY